MTRDGEAAVDGGTEDWRAAGNAAFKSKNYGAAAALYTRALDALAAGDPARAPLLANRAAARHRAGDAAAAAADAEAALAGDPCSARARHRAALARLALGDGAVAAAHLRALLDAPPGATPAPAPAAELARLAERAGLLAARARRAREPGPAAARLRGLLGDLAADAAGDGDDDFDPGAALAELAALLEGRGSGCGAAAAAAAFDAGGGGRTCLAFFTDAHCAAAAAALRAAAPWETATWRRLLGVALRSGGDAPAGAAAAELLAWAAGTDFWARTQLLAHPLPAAGGGAVAAEPPPLAAVVEALRGGGSAGGAPPLSSEAAAALARLVGACAADAASAAALAALGCRPLGALLELSCCAESLPSLEQTAGGGAGAGAALAPAERAALAELREKQRAVYDAAAVRLRRAALAALAALCGSWPLVQAEACPEGGGAARRGGGPLPRALLAAVQALHARAPQRTAPVLGRDGRPTAYAKRPFAADFADNPAGDFLASLDLSGGGMGGDAPGDAPGAEPPPPTQLELALAALAAAARHRGGTPLAAALHRGGALTLCGELFAYATPAVVERAGEIFALVCGGCAAAAAEALDERGARGLAALVAALPARRARLAARAADALATLVDGASGDDFARLAAPGGAVAAAARFALEEGEAGAASADDARALREAGARLVRAAAARAAAQQGLPPEQLPRGGCWDAVGAAALRRLCPPPAPPTPAPPPKVPAPPPPAAEPVDEGLSRLKRGFYPPPRATAKKVGEGAPAAATPAPGAPPPPERHLHGNGSIVIDEPRPEPKLPPPPPPPPPPAADREVGPDSDADVPDLVDVFDSTLSLPPAVRAARAAWRAIPPRDRVRWSQTSVDVEAWVAVPAGTRAAEVAVDVRPHRLAVRLRWAGAALDAPLHARVKASEARWWLEGAGVHVLVPKDEAGRWWKALLEGGEERSYHELLAEAVAADEPAPGYDEMDAGAKELLDQMLERQALLAAGELDLENGLDDFRIALGEASLRGA